MAINIDILPEDQFQELLKIEGDTLPLYYIWALHFEPPRPMTTKEAERRAMSDIDEEDMLPFGMQNHFAYVLCMLMKVEKPYIYKDADGDTVYILPNDPKNSIDWELCNVISNEHNAWCYRLSPRFWDPWSSDDDDYPLSDAWYYFRNSQTVPDFDLGNTETH